MPLNQNERSFAVSVILGFAHGAIASILMKPDAELRENLTQLKQELDERVSKLFYEHE